MRTRLNSNFTIRGVKPLKTEDFEIVDMLWPSEGLLPRQSDLLKGFTNMTIFHKSKTGRFEGDVENSDGSKGFFKMNFYKGQMDPKE